MHWYEDKTMDYRTFTPGTSNAMFISTATTSQDARVSVTSRQWVLWYLLCAVLFWLYASPLLFHDGFLQMNSDEANYVWKAQHISRDVGILASEQAWRRHPPLIPAIVGLLAKLMSLHAAVLVTTKTFAVIGIVLVYLLGVQLKGPVAGLIAGVLLAADPTYRGLSNILLLDIPLMILFIVCAWFLLRGGGCQVWAVGTGILALFVKDYGILVLAYALACIAWDFLIDRGWRPVAVLGLVLASSLATFVPLGYFQGHIPLWRHSYEWFAWFSWLGNEAQLKGWGILDNSLGWMVPGVQKRYLGLVLLFAFPFVFKMMAFFPVRTNVILFGWIAAILGPFLFSYTGDSRVILLFAPALYLIVGVCLAQGLRLVRTPAIARSVFAVLLLSCVFLLLMAQRNPGLAYYIKCRFQSYYPTGEWIRQNVSRSEGVVFTRSPHQVRFYAKSEFERDGGIFYGKDEWTGIPWTVPEFQRVLDRTDKTPYLIVDFDEKIDPPWFAPPNRDVAETIHALGFDVVHVVWVPADAVCDRPDSPYYSELPGFLKHLGLPLHRDTGATRERVDAVLFRRNGRPPPTTAFVPATRALQGNGGPS
jgi:hypothetical protein